MVVTCFIEFDNNPNCTFFAGQMVTGKITLQSDKPKQVKGVLLKINGFAHTSWSESSNTIVTDYKGHSTTKNTTIHYNGHEDYIASLTYLLGSGESQSLTIEPGIHTYNFACHLPNTCPSSFEGIYGQIRYTVRVALIRPWKFDQTFTKGFTVLKVMDLNYESPLLRVQCNAEVQKVFCCGPCKSDPLIMHVTLPQGGYVPGQSIPVSILVTNDSNVPVEEIQVQLVMSVCYYSQTPSTQTKHERILVATLKGERVPVHIKKLYNYALLVPATPPTCFNLCRIIQLAYQVEVEAKVKGWHANHVINVPVTIGNVPLMGVILQQPTSQMNGMQQQLVRELSMVMDNSSERLAVESIQNAATEVNLRGATAPNIDRTSSVPWEIDSNLPPPSYECAMHLKTGKINEDAAHDYGESDFTPRYPVFSVPSPTAQTDETDGYVNPALEGDKGTWL